MVYDISNLLEVDLPDNDAFLKCRETLSRIGIASKKENKLYQSCHILHKKGLFYIVHFKELFALDGKYSNLTEEDIGRRNTIANLLEQWKLLSVVNKEKSKHPVVNISSIKILTHKNKTDYELVTKYSIGKHKNVNSSAT